MYSKKKSIQFSRKKIITTIIIFVAFICLCHPLWAADEIKKIRVGVVPQFATQELRSIWDPVFLSVARRTNVHFILVPSAGIPEFEKKLRNGEFDLVYLNPYHMLIANKVQQYEPLVRDIGGTMRGIVVARKDSEITDVSQLNNQVIAFPAPNALGASLLVRAELANIHKLEIKPKYVDTHTSTYRDVMLGQAKAGGGVMNTFEMQSKEIQNSLRIIYKTQRVPTHPIAIHPRVEQQIRENIKQALLQMGQTEQGRDLLNRIPINKIGEASMADYIALEKMGLEKFVVE